MLDSRGLESADVYGHSMGGYIALTLAVRRPDLVRSLVLVGTGPGGPGHEPPPPETLDLWSKAFDLPREEAVRFAYPVAFAPGWVDDHPQEFEQWVAARLDPPTPSSSWLAQAGAAEAYRQAGVEVERIDVPALVVHGDEDRVVPLANGRLLASRMPRAELVVMKGSGHSPMLEEPEAFAEIVCDFLDRVS